MCESATCMISGCSPDSKTHFNRTRWPVYASHYPTGESQLSSKWPLYALQCVHRSLTIQLLHTRRFFSASATFKHVTSSGVAACALPFLNECNISGTSVQNILHFGQMVHTGSLHMYDYGSSKRNKEAYGTPKPPKYNMTKVRKVNSDTPLPWKVLKLLSPPDSLYAHDCRPSELCLDTIANLLSPACTRLPTF